MVVFAAVRKLSKLLGTPSNVAAPTSQPDAAKKASEASLTPGGRSAPQKASPHLSSPTQQVHITAKTLGT